MTAPNPPTDPTPPWLGDQWWGPFNDLIPIFPLNPSLGFTPPVVPAAPTPRYALWGFDNGWVGYIRQS